MAYVKNVKKDKIVEIKNAFLQKIVINQYLKYVQNVTLIIIQIKKTQNVKSKQIILKIVRKQLTEKYVNYVMKDIILMKKKNV